jgi:hypothetical protein
MTASTRTHGNLGWLFFAFGWVVLALWTVADGEPFWWRVALPVGMAVTSIGQYVWSRSPGVGGS